MRLAWDFMEHKVPKDSRHGTGLKIYLINAVFNGQTLQGQYWQTNPARTSRQLIPLSGGTRTRAMRKRSRSCARCWTTNSPTARHHLLGTGRAWPFATSCDGEPEYGKCLVDMPRELYGGIETDKVGKLWIGYALFYEMTGERKYLDAAGVARKYWQRTCDPEMPTIHRGRSASARQDG